MTTKSDDLSLKSVAERLLADLERLETTLAEARRIDIDSGKSLERARKLLETCSEHEQQLATQLKTLAVAIQATQARIAAEKEEQRLTFTSSTLRAEQQERERRIRELERAISDRIGRELKENEQRAKVA